jgi:hypothetical protein
VLDAITMDVGLLDLRIQLPGSSGSLRRNTGLMLWDFWKMVTIWRWKKPTGT